MRWESVREIFYRQHKPDGRVVFEAFWLTDFSPRRVGRREIFRMAKSRWEIENQGFSDAKNRYGFEPICHHEPRSLLALWLLTCLALIVERLYRLRHRHRSAHPVRTAIDLPAQPRGASPRRFQLNIRRLSFFASPRTFFALRASPPCPCR